MPWSTGSGSSRLQPRGASGAATAWIAMRSARNAPSCAAPFTVPGVVTGPWLRLRSVPTAAVASMSARSKFLKSL